MPDIRINIRYTGDDIGDLQPLEDSQIRTIFQGKLKEKFDAVSDILDQHNVQKYDIIDHAKTLRATINETIVRNLEKELEPHDMAVERDASTDPNLYIC